jgi:hypothetical protein
MTPPQSNPIHPARFPLVFGVVVALWTLLGCLFVIADQGWGAVCLAGIGSAIVNGSLAVVGTIFAIAQGIREQRVPWLSLAVALGAPLVSALLLLAALF